MNDLLTQLNKQIAIQKIKNESLSQQIEDQEMLESWQSVYFDIMVNCFYCDEAEVIAELGKAYETDLMDFNDLKVECLNLARYSSAASDYTMKIEEIDLPSTFNFSCLEDAIFFLRVDVHNAMLHLLTIRRNLQEESKLRTIESLL